MSFDYSTLDTKTTNKLKYLYHLSMILPKSVIEKETFNNYHIILDIYNRKYRGWELPKISNDYLLLIDDIIAIFEHILKPKIHNKQQLVKILENELNETNNINKKVIVCDEYLKKFQNIGYRYYKLIKYFDLSRFDLPRDLPLNAYILANTYKTDWITEDYFMLDLAVNLLFKAEYYCQLFYDQYAAYFELGIKNMIDYGTHILTLMKFYSMQSIICFINFVEIFINNTAWNYYLKNASVLDNIEFINKINIKNIYLSKKKQNPYYNFIDKIVVIPLLIKNNVLTYNDYSKYISKNNKINKKISNFKINYKYFLFIKEDIRDSIIHFHGSIEQNKTPILGNDLLWIEFARLAFDESLSLASNIWINSGNKTKNPEYCSYEKEWWLQRGFQRVKFESLQDSFNGQPVFNEKFEEKFKKLTIDNEMYGVSVPFKIRNKQK